MVRTIISLTVHEKVRLDRLSQKTRKSRAQLVREAIDSYLRQTQNKEDSWEETVRKTAGLWQHKGVSTDQYLAAVRKDWDRS